VKHRVVEKKEKEATVSRLFGQFVSMISFVILTNLQKLQETQCSFSPFKQKNIMER